MLPGSSAKARGETVAHSATDSGSARSRRRIRQRLAERAASSDSMYGHITLP
jgi:hypothetical protein